MLFAVAVLYIASVAKGSDNDGAGSRVLWSPSDGRSRQEWMSCNGLPAESCSRMPDKMRRLAEVIDGHSANPSSDAWKSNSVDGCILLTEEQLDYMIAEEEHKRMGSADHIRWKRQTLNFTAYPGNKWSLPIVYKFDGTHNSSETTLIKNEVRIWEEQTCLRFSQIPTGTNYTDHHILFSKPSTSTCNSYVGRVIYKPQVLNLGEGCLDPLGVPGIPVHELGHAIGLWHEQQRPDRDDHVTILQGNVPPSSYAVNYEKKYITTLLVPYHFGSVMHYFDGAFAITPGLHTMQARNPLYQQNMGQNVELSFDGARAINIAYSCDSLRCSGSPAITCLRGGYRNPNNCSMCKCPDGFGGTHCERIADAVNAVCGESISLNETDIKILQSPGYDSPGYYNNFQECSWLISGPADRELALQFVDAFGFLCSTNQGCGWHWVEVKYKRDMGLEGARFCCRTRPVVNITSESSEMLVIFKTNHEWRYRERGFRAVVTVGERLTTTSTTTTTTTTTTTRPSTLSSSTSTAAESKQTTSFSGHSALPCMFLYTWLLLRNVLW